MSKSSQQRERKNGCENRDTERMLRTVSRMSHEQLDLLLRKVKAQEISEITTEITKKDSV